MEINITANENGYYEGVRARERLADEAQSKNVRAEWGSAGVALAARLILISLRRVLCKEINIPKKIEIII